MRPHRHQFLHATLPAGDRGSSISASTISAVVVGIVNITSDVRRIVTAAVVVGIFAVDGTWTDRQGNSRAAGTRFDRNDLAPDVLAGLQNGLLAGCGIDWWRDAEQTDCQQANHQNRCG